MMHVPLLSGQTYGVVTEGVAGPRRQHPWFTLHLPRYLAVMQADTIATAAQVWPCLWRALVQPYCGAAHDSFRCKSVECSRKCWVLQHMRQLFCF